jgi:hypothetical protein
LRKQMHSTKQINRHSDMHTHRHNYAQTRHVRIV